MSIFSEHFGEEIAHLNRLLDDSNLTISCLFQLLRDHNIPVGSTELIKAREKVEADIQTLRTANAGLVERVRRLEKAGDRLVDWLRFDTKPSSVKRSIDQWDKAKGQA